MADQLVQRSHILLGMPAHALCAEAAEPAQRQTLQVLGQTHPQAVAQVGIDTVGQMQGQGLAQQPQRRAD